MRASIKILVAAAATLLVAPQFAMADDIEDQLRVMNERMAQLEGQLQATQDELDASQAQVDNQQDLIEKAGLERQAQSGLSAFLSQTEFSGLLAVSWTYNFQNPKTTGCGGVQGICIGDNSGLNDGENLGRLGITAPHHTNHNSFQLDQLWFGMKKAATSESRGGWGADLVWGSSADAQSSLGLEDDQASGELPHLYQAYVEYLAPWGEAGVLWKMGRFETLIGAESFRMDQNFNVTRGLLWALQPVNHTGLLVGGDIGDTGLEWAAAASNDYGNTMVDTDMSKTFVGRLGWSNETVGVYLNGLYGGDIPGFGSANNNNDAVGLIDLVVKADPTEALSMWVNFDWYTLDPEAGDGTCCAAGTQVRLDRVNLYGLAGAARYGLTEALGLAVRAEAIWATNFGYLTGFGDGSFVEFDPANNSATIWELTGTVDYALTDNLTLLGEVRYDNATVRGGSNNFFVTGRDGQQDKEQVLAIVQMMYTF